MFVTCSGIVNLYSRNKVEFCRCLRKVQIESKMKLKSKHFMFAFITISLLGIIVIFSQENPVKGSNYFPSTNPSIINDALPFMGINPPTAVSGQNGEDILVEITQEPRIINEYVDLASGLADNDKFVFIVRRGNGKYTKFIIPANFQGDEKALRAFLDILPEDLIITGYPLEPRIRYVDLDKPDTQKATQTPIIIGDPYPAPKSTSYPVPTSNPYP